MTNRSVESPSLGRSTRRRRGRTRCRKSTLRVDRCPRSHPSRGTFDCCSIRRRSGKTVRSRPRARRPYRRRRRPRRSSPAGSLRKPPPPGTRRTMNKAGRPARRPDKGLYGKCCQPAGQTARRTSRSRPGQGRMESSRCRRRSSRHLPSHGSTLRRRSPVRRGQPSPRRHPTRPVHRRSRRRPGPPRRGWSRRIPPPQATKQAESAMASAGAPRMAFIEGPPIAPSPVGVRPAKPPPRWSPAGRVPGPAGGARSAPRASSRRRAA